MNKFLFADQLEKPCDLIKFRQRNQGGLQLHNIDCKSSAMQIKTFLEMAISRDFQTSQYYNSLYEYHVMNNTSISNPGCPPYYTNQFFEKIKTAMKENNVEGWSSKQWYTYLLNKDVLQTEVYDDDGRISWETKKCQVETEFSHFEWDITWARAHMQGLTNEARSMLWKFFHNLLPTQSRLHRITRTTPTSACVNCDTGAEDHAWYHTFVSCPATKTIMDWLVETLEQIPIQDVSIEMALFLQFPPPIPENDLLCAVWLVGETLTYSWARRRNREAPSILSLTVSLRTKALHMSKSKRHSHAGQQLCDLLDL